MMTALWKCSFFSFPPPSLIPLIKKNRDKTNTSQATTGITVVFVRCCGSYLLCSGPLWICKWWSSQERSWGHLAVESILPIVEMVRELAMRRWLVILQGLVSGQFSFSSCSLSVFLSLLLLLFIPMSKCCLFLAAFPFCSGTDPK